MTTLPDPRHEAFAKYIAFGHDFSSAYVHAGFSVKNIKTRAKELGADAAVRARIAHLKKCLPDITDLQERYAPSLLLMPESQDQMLAWLWQVMNGTRKILPIQLRAATLFCRMRGWHLAKPMPVQAGQEPQSQPPSARLSELEQTVLADFSRQIATTGLTGLPESSEALSNFHSRMADLRHLAESECIASPRDGWRESAAANAPPEPLASAPPASSPPPSPALVSLVRPASVENASPSAPTSGDTKSPSQPLQNQTIAPKSSPSGDKTASSPSAQNPTPPPVPLAKAAHPFRPTIVRKSS